MSNIKPYELITICDRHMDLTPIGEVIDKYELNGVSYVPKVDRFYDAKQDKDIEVDKIYWGFNMHNTEARELEDDIAGIVGVKRFLLVQKAA